jgi:hypothetical protein
MELSVREVGEHLGVSHQRVHAMLKSGALRGRKAAGRWFIDDSQLVPLRRVSRPLSQRIAWAAIVGPTEASWLSQPEASRLRGRLHRLPQQPNAPQVLASWLAARAVSHDLFAPEPDALMSDPRLVRAGISDPRSGLSTGKDWEFYAQPGTLADVAADHLLVESPTGAVRIREAPMRVTNPIPLLLLAADLADRGGSREVRRAAELIREASL